LGFKALAALAALGDSLLEQVGSSGNFGFKVYGLVFGIWCLVFGIWGVPGQVPGALSLDMRLHGPVEAGCHDGQTDGLTDEGTVGRSVGRTDRRTDRQISCQLRGLCQWTPASLSRSGDSENAEIVNAGQT
jgi:hypothetical protein